MVSWDVATDETTPIRVELVDDGAMPSSEPPAPEWQREPPAGRGVGLATVIGAIVVAALVGVVIGRSGGSPDGGVDSAAASSAPSAPTVETIAPVTAAAAGGAVDGAIGHDTILTTSVRVDPRLAGSELTLVAPRQDGWWARLDLGEGRRDEIADVDPSTFLTDQPVVAGDGWFVYAVGDGSTSAAVWRDASSSWETVPVAMSGRLLRQAATDSFWRAFDAGPATAPATSDQVFDLWDLVGGPTAQQLVAPPAAAILGGDPQGGLIVHSADGLVRVMPGGQLTLGAGELIAANEVVLAVWRCDDDRDCELAVIDRRTGRTRLVTIDVGESPVGPPAAVDAVGLSDLSSPLTRDGAHVAVNMFSPTGYELGVVDLATGGYRRVADHSRPFSVAWTPDGRFLLHTNLGVPFAFDRSTGQSFPIAPDGQLGGWNGLVASR